MMQLPFDLHSLRAFVAVCESQSMADAARMLDVTQSATSQLIKALEKQSGMVLLDRDFRPLRPTAQGLLLLEMAKDLLAHAQSMADRLSEQSQEAIVRLGCMDSFAGACGGTLVRALANRVRELSLWSGLTPGLSSALERRELDIAICTVSPLINTRITQRLLFSERFLAVIGTQKSLATVNSQKDLSDLPLMRYSHHSVIGQQIERYLLHIGLHSPPRYEFDATDPMMDMVSSGEGYCVTTPLCLWQARHYLSQLRVVPLADSRLGTRTVFCLSRIDEWQSLARQIEDVTRYIVYNEVLPQLRACLPGIPVDAIDVPPRPQQDCASAKNPFLA